MNENRFIILGKQQFVSSKGNQCYVLSVGYAQDGVEGMNVERVFVSDELYNKVYVKQTYIVVYGKRFNGNAYVADLLPIEHN